MKDIRLIDGEWLDRETHSTCARYNGTRRHEPPVFWAFPAVDDERDVRKFIAAVITKASAARIANDTIATAVESELRLHGFRARVQRGR